MSVGTRPNANDTMSPSANGTDSTDNNTASKEGIDHDQFEVYTNVLASKLGTKAILLQIVPSLNIASILAVSTGILPLVSLLLLLLPPSP